MTVSKPSSRSQKSAILIIDDDEPVAFGLSKLLERHGFPTRVATNGKHGIRIIRSANISLVVTDIFMAEMEGFETIMQVRQLRPELKVIAMSGGSPYVGIDCLSMAKTLGASEVVAKPVGIETLLAALGRLGFHPPLPRDKA